MTVDPAEHPDHPHGSTVEQVHRILGRAYADEPDREELVKFVTKQAQRTQRPSTIPGHLDEAERLLAFAFIDDDPDHAPGGYYVDDDHCSAQVRAAEVHARIAHAAAAAGMLQPPPPSEPDDAPGLAALQSLAASVERLAAALEAQR